jgi:hypothetical protein
MSVFPSIQHPQLTVRSHEVLLRNVPEESAKKRAPGISRKIGIFGGGLVVSPGSGLRVARF